MALPRKPKGFKNQILTVIPRKVLQQARNHPLLRPTYLTDVGYFPDARYHYRQRENGCRQHILIYCTQGKGFVEGKSRRQIITKDVVLLIPQGVSHVYGSLKKHDPWHIYWTHYAGSNASAYNPRPSDDFCTVPVPPSKFPTLTQLFHSIFDLLERGTTLNNMIHSAHTFTYLLSELFFHNSKPDEASSDAHSAPNHVETAISYMKARIQEHVTLEELADRSNLSKGHLTHLFKENTGESPIRFYINLKIQQACRYLDLTEMSIKQIAATMGYSDPYYFSRLFTRTVGMSPSVYRSIKKG